jgi:hypothetical protein
MRKTIAGGVLVLSLLLAPGTAWAASGRHVSRVEQGWESLIRLVQRLFHETSARASSADGAGGDVVVPCQSIIIDPYG